MAVRPVLRYPNRALKEVSRALADGEDPGDAAADLLDTMSAHQGCVGLAAPQIGAPLRIVAVDVSEHPKAESSSGRLVLVNPVIVREEGADVAREGCLSIPHLTANVRRATTIEVEARGLASSPRASRPGACCTRSTTWTACSFSTEWTPCPRTCSAASASPDGMAAVLARSTIGLRSSPGPRLTADQRSGCAPRLGRA